MTLVNSKSAQYCCLVNELGRFLADRDAATSDIGLAQIEERTAGGLYLCRLFASGAPVLAKPRGRETFLPQALVVLGAPSASGRVTGANYVILSAAEQRGLSATTPDRIARVRDVRPTVVSYDPDPLVLERGGEAGTLILNGFGFSGPVSLAGTGLTETAAQEITATTITLHLAAPAEAALGERDLSLGSTLLPDVVRVVESSRVIGPYLYVTSQAWDAGFTLGVPRLRKINVPDLEVLAEFVATADPVAAPIGGTLEQDGDEVIWIHGEDGAPAIVRRLAVADDTQVSEESITPQPSPSFNVVVHESGKFFMAYGGLWECEPPAATQVFGSGSFQLDCVAVDGGDAYIAGDSFGMRRVDLATFSEQAVGLTAFRAVVIGAHVWVARGTTVQKRDRDDLTVITTIAIGGGVGEMCIVGGMLYALRYGSGIIVSIDPATDDSEDIVNLAVDCAQGMTTDGTNLYVVGEVDLRIRKIEAATGAVLATSEPISLSDSEYAEQVRFVTT